MQPTTRKPLYNKTRSVALYLMISALQGTGYMEGATAKEQAGPSPSNSVIPAPTFYVDATGGRDSNDGLTVASAWQTLDRVNSESVSPGSTVLFKRGEVWRGQIKARSGTAQRSTLYGAWGTGAKPMILGSLNRKSPGVWIQGIGHWSDREGVGDMWRNGGPLWRCTTPFDTDVGNLIFNGGTSVGFKKWSQKDLTAQGDYYYNYGKKQLTIYSTVNPGLFYSDIEVALTHHLVDLRSAQSFVTCENLAVKYGAAHGFSGSGNAFITIRNCDVSFVGGGDLWMDGSNVRFGNGIEFWGNAHDCLVEKCRIWEIYDTALTSQTAGDGVSHYNITYRNNVMWNCAYSSFECWCDGAVSTRMTNIRFENNTCVGAGEGWGKPPQRPYAAGYQVDLTHDPFSKHAENLSGIYIRNNIFYQYTQGLWVQRNPQWDAALTLTNNFWSQAGGHLKPEGPARAMFLFSSYETFNGKDAADPLFVNLGAQDFHLQAGSPCVDTGLDIGIIDDCDSVVRPAGRGFDIGAYER